MTCAPAWIRWLRRGGWLTLAGLAVSVFLAASVVGGQEVDPSDSGAMASAGAAVTPTGGSPEPVSVPPWLVARLDRAVQQGIEEEITPGAALVIGFSGQVALSRTWGHTGWDPTSPVVTDSTVYDLASLTKAVATTTVAMRLVEAGVLDLDVPLRRYLDGWPARGARGRITPRHLLTHTSGLPAAARLWRANRGGDAFVAAITELSLVGPPGSVQVYSDLGMIVLAEAIETLTGKSLDALTREWVTTPLGMRETTFRPLAAGLDRARIAPTELDPRTGRRVRGRVHDANAAALGGVAGHAGLFGSSRDLAVFAGSVLWGTPTPVACPTTVQSFASRDDPSSRFGLGWEKPVPEVIWSDFFSDAAFGHTGFTGTSLWIDPQRDLYVVFLTNRLASSRGEEAIHDLRRWVHRAVHGWIVDPMSAPAIARAAAEGSEEDPGVLGQPCPAGAERSPLD